MNLIDIESERKEVMVEEGEIQMGGREGMGNIVKKGKVGRQERNAAPPGQLVDGTIP